MKLYYHQWWLVHCQSGFGGFVSFRMSILSRLMIAMLWRKKKTSISVSEHWKTRRMTNAGFRFHTIFVSQKGHCHIRHTFLLGLCKRTTLCTDKTHCSTWHTIRNKSWSVHRSLFPPLRLQLCMKSALWVKIMGHILEVAKTRKQIIFFEVHWGVSDFLFPTTQWRIKSATVRPNANFHSWRHDMFSSYQSSHLLYSLITNNHLSHTAHTWWDRHSPVTLPSLSC